MGWFSRRSDGSFLGTTAPGGIELRQYLGVVNGETIIGIDFDYKVPGETNGMMMVAMRRTAIKLG